MIPQLLTALTAVTNKEGYVVTTHPSVLLEDINRACKNAGVTIVSCHGLRHTFVSLCFSLKIDLRQVQDWGGWKDQRTLQRIYLRIAASTKAEAQRTFSAFFS